MPGRFDRRGVVSILYIATVGLILGGLGTLVAGHVVPGFGYGTVFGPLVIALGVGVGMIAGGVSSPWAYVVIPILVAFGLILIDHYNIFGVQAWGL